jgi:hypothetical protein
MSDLEPAATVGDNKRDGMRGEVFKNAARIGEHSGPGDTPIYKLATLAIEASYNGLIEPTDAKLLFQEYKDASKKAGGTPGSTKTNASKLRKLIEFGCFPDSEQAAERAASLRKFVKKAKPPFDGLVEVARYRLKLQRKLTNDEIAAAITKAPPKAKAKASEWQAVAKTVGKLLAVKDAAAIDHAITIRDQLNNYIAQNGEEIHEEVQAA